MTNLELACFIGLLTAEMERQDALTEDDLAALGFTPADRQLISAWLTARLAAAEAQLAATA